MADSAIWNLEHPRRLSNCLSCHDMGGTAFVWFGCWTWTWNWNSSLLDTDTFMAKMTFQLDDRYARAAKMLPRSAGHESSRVPYSLIMQGNINLHLSDGRLTSWLIQTWGAKQASMSVDSETPTWRYQYISEFWAISPAPWIADSETSLNYSWCDWPPPDFQSVLGLVHERVLFGVFNIYEVGDRKEDELIHSQM